MAWFEYDGQCPNGTVISGRLEAMNHAGAIEQLTQMQVSVTRLEPAARPPARRPIAREDFIFFNEQLASMAEAGIALDEGLAQLAKDLESPRLRRLIAEIAEDLRAGTPLADAIAKREAEFPVLYARVIHAGVESGQLSATLLNLNQHLRLLAHTRWLLVEATAYPLFVLLLAFCLVSLFLIAVVPSFEGIYLDFGTALPGPTLALITLARMFPWILIGLGLVVVVLLAGRMALRRTTTGRRILERALLRVPVLGRIHRASLLARFMRSVCMSVGGGVPLPEAVRLAAGAAGSPVLSADGERLAVQVERGESAFSASQSLALIPGMFGYAVQIAVGRGNLADTLTGLSNVYQHRAICAQSLLRSLLLPLMIVVVGGMIGAAILCLFLPLVCLINSISVIGI